METQIVRRSAALVSRDLAEIFSFPWKQVTVHAAGALLELFELMTDFISFSRIKYNDFLIILFLISLFCIIKYTLKGPLSVAGL